MSKAQSLETQIAEAQRLVKTDAYQMSLGEIVSMYEKGEIIVHPEFQRLFRWEIEQKSRLIESILLGIPLPPIFVFERDDGKWELVDGLQRLSTLFEFMGILKNPEGGQTPPSLLEGTKYLPALRNTVWEGSLLINEVPLKQQIPLPTSFQLAIRRARIGVEILKRPSDKKTKYDLFQRLNSGGTQANAQELRNCVMIMINDEGFKKIKNIASSKPFKELTIAAPEQLEKQRHMEFATRFLVYTFSEYSGQLDVEDHINTGISELLESKKFGTCLSTLTDTFELLHKALGKDALRRQLHGKYQGKVGFIGLETVAAGVGYNLASIQKRAKPIDYVRKRVGAMWDQPEVDTFITPGLRGTSRLLRTLPFGKNWFSK